MLIDEWTHEVVSPHATCVQIQPSMRPSENGGDIKTFTNKIKIKNLSKFGEPVCGPGSEPPSNRVGIPWRGDSRTCGYDRLRFIRSSMVKRRSNEIFEDWMWHFKQHTMATPNLPYTTKLDVPADFYLLEGKRRKCETSVKHTRQTSGESNHAK